MTPLSLSLAMAITVLASALQAATGMGMALVAAPLLALLDPEPAPVPALFAVMLLSALVTWRTRADILRAPLPMALLGLFVGCAAGAALRDVLAGPRFNHVFALLILLAVGVSLLRVPVPTNRVSLLLGGLASGVLGTLSGAHGPPIALVMQHVPVRQMRATLCAFFAIGCAVSLAMLAAAGRVDRISIVDGVLLFPAVFAGLWLGLPLTRWLHGTRARWAVLAMSASSAVLLLAN